MEYPRKINNLIKRMFIASIQKERLYRASVITCITYKKITVFGENKNKTNPVQKEFADIPAKIYCHAEVDALIRAKRLLSPIEIEQSTLIIVRYKIEGLDFVYGKSVPCKGCQNAILKHGIKNVICHDGNSFINWEV